MKRTALLVFVVALLVLGAVGYATANVVTYNGVGNPLVASGSVLVTCTIGPKLTLQIDTPDAAQSVNFGTVLPGGGASSKIVTLTVQSNKTYDIGAAQTGAIWGTAGMNATRSFSATLPAQAIPGGTFYDTIGINPSYSVPAGSYSGNVVYTAVQN